MFVSPELDCFLVESGVFRAYELVLPLSTAELAEGRRTMELLGIVRTMADRYFSKSACELTEKVSTSVPVGIVISEPAADMPEFLNTELIRVFW